MMCHVFLPPGLEMAANSCCLLVSPELKNKKNLLLFEILAFLFYLAAAEQEIAHQ